MWPFKPKPEPFSKRTQEQIDNIRDFFERMAEMEPLLPAIKERERIERAVDEAFEKRDG